MKKKETFAKLTLVVTALIWGAGFIFSQAALDTGLGPAVILFGKFGIATILCGIMFFKHLKKNLSFRMFIRVLPVGLILVAGFFTQIYGQKYSSPSNCALITAAYVVITPFLWKLAFRRRVPRLAYLASVLCFAGVVLLSVDFSAGLSLRIGDLLTIACAILFAMQIVATEAFVGEMNFQSFLFVQFLIATLVSFAVFMVTERDYSGLFTLSGGGSVLYLGCLSTFLCYIMQTSAQRYVESSATALILSMESMFGAIFSVLLGYDKLNPELLTGGALIMLSVMMPEIIGIIARGKKLSNQSDE